MSESQFWINMSNVSKAFWGVQALKKARLDLKKSEVLALVGENGAGKSTLMKILTGIYTKDEGEIIFDGKVAEIKSVRDSQRLGISIIHQELNLIQHLSVAQNIFLGRENPNSFLTNNKVINLRCTEIFMRLGLKFDPEQKVSELSVAKQQMVEIAKALSYESKVIIMDEPTAALASAEVEELFSIIKSLREQGCGIIYISHRLDELKMISDRITIMRDGQYIDNLNTETADLEQIIKLMVGREIFVNKPEYKNFNYGREALRVENLSLGKRVRGASFNLYYGEVLGFAGLVGAGRTELMELIFGVNSMDSGCVWIDEKAVSIKSPAEAVEKGMAYISEDRKQYGLVTNLPVSSNLSLACMKKFLKTRIVLRESFEVQNANEKVDLLQIKTPSVSQKVCFLSGGNQQKVVIGKWLTSDSRIFIFDEPTRGVDVGAKNEIYKIIQNLADVGNAVIVVSSELPEIIRTSHRVVTMCEGRITGELRSDEITQENIMRLAVKRGIEI